MRLSRPPLTRAILRAVNNGFVCRSEQTNLGKSVESRTAVEHAYGVLLALDIAPNARVVAGGLLKAGRFICADRTLVQPIPPALRPVLPQGANR